MASPLVKIWQRVLVHWPLKLTLLSAATVLMLGPYMLLQRFRVFEPRTLPLTSIDEWAGFSAAWAWMYILQYVQVPLLPMFASSREQLWRYIVGFAAVCVAAFVVFFFWPIEGPRPAIEQREAANWLYQLLVSIDRPGNALPSLHVALSTYSMCFAHRLFGETSHRLARMRWLAFGWLIVALITWSTVATKQHYLFDGIAGFGIAVVAHHLVWRMPWFAGFAGEATPRQSA